MRSREEKARVPARTLIIALALVLAGGCSVLHQGAEQGRDPELTLPAGALGSSRNPVKCDGPAGEHQYLKRLRGPDGQPVRYQRLGSVGQGAFGHVVDLYLVESRDGTVRREVFLDMYFPGHRENQPVPGFFLADQTL